MFEAKLGAMCQITSAYVARTKYKNKIKIEITETSNQNKLIKSSFICIISLVEKKILFNIKITNPRKIIEYQEK